MNDNNSLIKLTPKQGFNDIFRIGKYNMNLTQFGLLKLAKGTSYKGNTGEYEVAFVLKCHSCALKLHLLIKQVAGMLSERFCRNILKWEKILITLLSCSLHLPCATRTI